MSATSGATGGPEAVDVLTVTLNPAIDQTVWVPGFRAGEVNRVEHDDLHAGGKGVNVAATLARVGLDVTVTGFLGRDNAGIFEHALADLGVRDRFVRRPGSTRTGVKIVDERAGATTDINFPGTAPTPRELLELERCVADLARHARWVVLAGSLPPGVPPDLYARYTDLAHAAGARVALDTSGAALAPALLARPDLIKPNRSELEELTGRPLLDHDALVAAVRRVQAGGIGTVVVSLGAGGALFVDGDDVVFAQPLAVDVVSTVGAGDAMVAGTIAGLLRGLPLTGTAALATACSAAAISRTDTHRTAGGFDELARTVTTIEATPSTAGPNRGNR